MVLWTAVCDSGAGRRRGAGVTAPPIVLASASEARARMLERAGVAVVRQPADLDEASIQARSRAHGCSVADAAIALAEAKARAVAGAAQGSLVVGADQMLDCDGRWFSKARSRDEAAAALRALRGRTHRLVSGAVIVAGDAVLWRGVEEAALAMRAFSDDFLDAYLTQMGDAALASVGAYQIEGLGAQLFDRVEGDLFCILGLPLLPLLAALRRLGALST